MKSVSVTRRWWPLALVAALAAALMVAASPAHAETSGTIAVCLTDSSGNNLTLDDDKAWYQPNGGSINYVGAVGPSGCREQTLAVGANVEVWVKYNGTYSQHQTGVVPAGSTLRFDFYTTNVTLQYDHAIAFGGPTGDSAFFSKPSMELLSDGVNPVHFRLDGTGGASARTTLLWPVANGPGATFNRALFVARLLDHAGGPLSGGVVGYYRGGWHDNVGVTDANGNAAFAIEASSPSITVRMGYLGTINQQGPSQASVVTFHTALVNAKLVDADGNPLDTGSASYYAGGWHTIGNTSGGQVSVEMLPGSYSFSMSYNHLLQQLNNVAISGPVTDVVFQTGRLTVYFSQAFTWNTSQFHPFDAPTMEFLPSTIFLNLAGCRTAGIPIAAGDHLVKSGIVATLSDNTNHPLAGGIASAYASGWKSVGTTASNGRTCAALDGKFGNTAVAMTYDGTRQQIVQHQPTQSIYAFKTTDVTVELLDSTGTPMDTGTASYYAGGWHTIGNTSGGQTHVQMLPGKYSFAMSFKGTRQQQNGVAISGSTDTVTFQTGSVHSVSGTATSYYAGGWKPFTNDMELLPGSYTFHFSDGTANTRFTLSGGTTNNIH